MELSTNKTKVLQIRMTPADYEKLVSHAKKERITLAEWIRRAINK